MTWMTVLGGVLILVALISLFGVSPRGGRPAQRTSLMTAARVVLLVLGVVLVIAALR